MKNNKESFFVKTQEILIYVLFISQFLFIVSFGNIGTLPLTIPFIVSVIFVVFSLLGFFFGDIKISFDRLIIFLFISIVCFFSYFFNRYNHNLNSLLIYLYYFLIYLLIDARIKGTGMFRLSKIFIILTTVFSAYGLYQFIAYNLIDLPFKELIPRALWVDGYNILQVKDNIIDGMSIYKAHSIYAEASTLSRYSAMGILLSLLYSKKITRKLLAFSLIFNFIALVLSFSGSGLIFLVFGFLFLILFLNKKTKIKITVFATFALIIAFSLPYTRHFLLTRIGEFVSPNTSGYYRFVLPFKIGFESMFTDFIGFGVGNDEFAISAFGGLESGIANGFGKIFVECGLIGILIFILFLRTVKGNNKDLSFKIYFLFLILMCATSTFLDPTVWCFVCILTINNQSGELKYERKNSVVYDRLL